MMKNYIKEMRIKHWIKNCIIFIPLFFNKSLLNIHLIQNAILAFVAFSFISSSIYIINDIFDIEKDKQHPIKKNRPIASGAISIKNGILLSIVLIILTVLINIYLNNSACFIICVIYFLLNMGYSCFRLKDIPIVDIIIIVIGFILRLLIGASATMTEISNWLYLIMFAISFYLAVNKRKCELENKDSDSREVLNKYSSEFLNNLSNIFMTLIIVFYSLWAVNSDIVNELLMTIPLVMIIVVYYSYIISVKKTEDIVSLIFDNKIFFSMICLYGIVMMMILY